MSLLPSANTCCQSCGGMILTCDSIAPPSSSSESSTGVHTLAEMRELVSDPVRKIVIIGNPEAPGIGMIYTAIFGAAELESGYDIIVPNDAACRYFRRF